MQLSRAGEAGKLTRCKIGTSISNKIRYKDRMDERVKSSLCEREFVFPPYNATQLEKIMAARKDAFHGGVLEDSVIPRSAALAAREHGDARKAIDILRYAGEIAQTTSAANVREKFVIEARERASSGEGHQQRYQALYPYTPAHRHVRVTSPDHLVTRVPTDRTRATTRTGEGGARRRSDWNRTCREHRGSVGDGSSSSTQMATSDCAYRRRPARPHEYWLLVDKNASIPHHHSCLHALSGSSGSRPSVA